MEGVFGRVGEEESDERRRTFEELKPYCLELLDLLHNPTPTARNHPSLDSFLLFLRASSPRSLQPFFDYSLFPLLLLLDAAVECRTPRKSSLGADHSPAPPPQKPFRISDMVAERSLECLEVLLLKCSPATIEQMVMIIKKLTSGALLPTSVATEEFREGVIKCFKALVANLSTCSDYSCACKKVVGLPALFEEEKCMAADSIQSQTFTTEQGGCLLAFLQSEAAAPAVGHWLSLLLQAADTEAERGHLGNSRLRIEAFLTVRIFVAKVGTADALGFFLPGVVSKFIKVLHVSRAMLSGAGGNVESINQAIRGLAEYLMIVLDDEANRPSSGTLLNATHPEDASPFQEPSAFLEELRRLPSKDQVQGLDVEDTTDEVERNLPVKYGTHGLKKNVPGKLSGSFRVNRTKAWVGETSANIQKLLTSTFPSFSLHPEKKLRKALVAAIRGLLLKCAHTLKDSRVMLLECLCALVVDDSEEVSSSAQEILQFLFSCSGRYNLKDDGAEMLSRLVEKLPGVLLTAEETFTLSTARKLLVILYYSGPSFTVDQLLYSPVKAAAFLDSIACCLGQSTGFSGSLERLVLERSYSKGYIQSVTELNAVSRDIENSKILMGADPQQISRQSSSSEEKTMHQQGIVRKRYEFPTMPPWFGYIGSYRLYSTLANILRLVGSALLADPRGEGHVSAVLDIPLQYLRQLILEIRMRDYNNESWMSWYNRTGSGLLLRKASTAVCILNELIYGLSDKAVESLSETFHRSALDADMLQKVNLEGPQHVNCQSAWSRPKENSTRSQLIDCIGGILHEYLSPEVWYLSIERGPSPVEFDGEAEDMPLHFFTDVTNLHEVILQGVGTFCICLGHQFALSGFLHTSIYILLENLVSLELQVRSTCDGVLQAIAFNLGYNSVGHLVVANADYLIDSICQQLRHLDLNPQVPNVLAAMFSYVGVAEKILPLFEEPMHSVSHELEILGRNQHPDLTIPFLKAVCQIAKSLKHEANTLPHEAKSFLEHVTYRASEMSNGVPERDSRGPCFAESEVEEMTVKLADSRRYRRIVGSVTSSCLIAATPFLASTVQLLCLVAADIIEDGISALSNVEAAYKHEKETKEEIEEIIESCSLYGLKDTLDVAEATDENRLLPSMNRIWPFLVVSVQNRNPAVVRKCLGVICSTVQICGGDFFCRRFLNDGNNFWRFLTTSAFHTMPNTRKESMPLQLPFRSITPHSSDEPLAEVSNLKVQVAVLSMIADLALNKKSAKALELVLKKVSGLVVGIACSGVVGLHDAAMKALRGLASIDQDLVWLLLADVYFSLKKNSIPLPPTPSLPGLSAVLPPPTSPKDYLYVQYGGRTYGFDLSVSSVETTFSKLNSVII
ncbi:hypothetical protein MLD38_012606 [Melastoma candidum]|uniref:Uncharacterized protein n=1 Tax=Melastoma candidum TaxID=119954 RepID=A0ACB9R6W6_9MYRT|nr:hypothetical protein MLD38_012606 [Melastoma candidum]